MAKGIKKIKRLSNSYELDNYYNAGEVICIYPNEEASFLVGEWYSETTEEEKRRNITWLWMDQQKRRIFNKTLKPAGVPYGVTLPRKLCGFYAFYLEASLSGGHDERNTGLYVFGKCEKKVTSSSWSKKENTADNSEINYGHDLFISLETEGVNGETLTLESYSAKTTTAPIQKVKVKCVDGALKAKFTTMSCFMAVPGLPSDLENFYIKVLDITGEYIKNANGGDKILHFTIKNERVMPVFEIPTNTAPLRIEETPKEEEVKTEGIIDAYFAKEEFSLEAPETAGQYEYVFQRKNVDIDKDKIAAIIKKNVAPQVKADKKYAKLDDIKNALTKSTYEIGDSISFNLYKLGANFIKINSAPLEEEVYVVAKTFLLDGKEVSITIKEKETILIDADANVPVLEAKENGTELTTLKATVENGLAKVKIKLRPKADEDLKTWKEKLLKGKKEEAYSYTFKNETVITDTNKKQFATIILNNAKEGKQGNTKIATGKTAFVDDVEKALESKTYGSGTTISFDTYKTQTESLWLKAECQGETIKHEKEFLKRDGEYFVIGKGKCPRCEQEITLKQIEDLFGVHRRSTAFREEVVKYLNQFIEQRKNTDKPIHLNTCLRKAHFFAQVGAETSGINTDWIIETDVVPYTPANIRNVSIFGDRSGILERRGQIETFCEERPQIKLLSFLYANENGKGNGNGNEGSGDGYKYRGRGLKQLTGKDNYINASTTFKEIFPDEYIDLEANPDKVKEAKYAVLSAIAYWEKNEIWKTADTLKESTDINIQKIRKMVNGGLAGWKDAKKFFEKAVQVFKVNECGPINSSSGEWHDPLDNPMLCLYSQGGGTKKPWHGSFGPTIRDGVNKHTGMDLFAKPGTNVYSCVKGEVVRSEINSSMFGELIVIKVIDEETFKSRRKNPFVLKYSNKSEIELQNFDHNGPFYLVYAHLKERKVAIGDIVNAGKIIGLTGTSGENGVPFSTKNPHLHFEIMNVEKQAGLDKKCNPGVYLTYKDEDTLTDADKEEQEEVKITPSYWTQ
ncbi:M23 family metallopeptidase [Flavobacterium sp. JLP]|uniref:peptidoglycan DD-metalloendopeptidase family protein n=1 Tax=Flavobacterium sp. JLP TaxID=2783793 RepID=UPI00188BD85F|nr:peptidoglycan DD-metalloendopeptidase family protein [Flavobacterium sp. JLP]MBF4505748.1 M23 family metallopeptidase [Flavobacterium sp. JLP]